MKRLFLFVLIFMFALAGAGYADDSDSVSKDDFPSDDLRDVTNNLKYFSDKQFDEAIQHYKSKFSKQKKKNTKNTQSATSSFDGVDASPELDVLNDVINHKENVMIPVICKTENGKILYPGHYILSADISNERNSSLLLSQGNKVYAVITAHGASEDAKQDSINYGRAVGYSDRVKLIYGNIDVALEGWLYVVNEKI